LIRDRLSHYQIISKLGSGGMGEVYLAIDTVLNRRVALKVLTADLTRDLKAVRYFKREAQAAATLDHPNICTIHEIGEDGGRGFIVMQYVEGETLAARIERQPLAPHEVLSVACQLADALAAAHSVGLIHRDIKPHNIMLTPEGRLKVLDFGLATRSAAGLPAGAARHAPAPAAEGLGRGSGVAGGQAKTLSLRSETGALVGTLQYMSPEQVRGEALDVRTDVFSFGSVMFEAVTGRPLFARENASDTMEAIKKEPAPPLGPRAGEPSAELQRIVLKCLEKERGARYDSAKELFEALDELRRMNVVTTEAEGGRKRAYLRASALVAAALAALLAVVWLAGPFRGAEESAANSAAVARGSIAVLPFKGPGGDPATEYLSDGITLSLINQLSQIPNLKVISRNSAFRYKGKDAEPQEVGRALGVSSVLNGNIEQRGDHITVFLTISDVRQNKPVWGRRFVSTRRNALNLQSDILRAVVQELRPQSASSVETRLRKSSTENVEAYNLYVKGMFHLNKRTPASLTVALESFKEALALDPGYALALSGLADGYSLLDDFSMEAPAVSQELAERAALQALEIDPDLAEAHSALGLIYRDYRWDWPAAERALKRALELNPNYATTHNRYGWFLISVGRYDEALMYMQQARDLDPHSLNINTAIGLPHYFSGNYEKAVEEFQRTLQLDPEFFPANLYLGLAYVRSGRAREAVEIFKRLKKVNDGPDMDTALAYAYVANGQQAEARAILKSFEDVAGWHVPSFNRALVYAQLGESDQAFQWLQKAYDDRTLSSLIKVDPMLDPVRDDSRFRSLLQKLNFGD